ncbi:MAG: hypothetical protein CML13_12230 [Puniceicoccaceae bacterium]|nr:hypothetical protein [Puniceicoccaceae bacterium]|tara:strand:- start:69 stop:1049 length:981 start_codon:yes stop_codon:yes gene_type:complete
MNKHIKLGMIASLVCLQSIQGVTDEEVIAFVNGEQTANTQHAPSSVGLEGSSTAFFILNYDSELVEGLFRLIESEKHSNHWKQAFIRLRIIATADPGIVGLNRVIDKALAIENMDMDSEEKLAVLSSAYGTVARFPDGKALSFLKQRVEPSFWEGRELETKVFYDHAPHLNTTHDGITESVMAIAEMGNDQAKKLLSQLSKDKKYEEMPNVQRSFKAAKYYHESAELLIAGIENAYAKRLELRGASTPEGIVTEPALEIPADPPAPEAVQVVEEVSPSESAIEEPAEVAPVEVAEETSEQSSQWWLWLVGLLVVVGGLALVVRRKS